jgi:hypothetical protein
MLSTRPTSSIMPVNIKTVLRVQQSALSQRATHFGF